MSPKVRFHSSALNDREMGEAPVTSARRPFRAAGFSPGIGILSGLIGLGRREIRLPMLTSVVGYTVLTPYVLFQST